MKLFEMEGFLRGKCIPRDLKVNETNAEYLVRKFAEADAMCAALAAENAGLKSKGREVLNEACKVYEELNATISSDSGDFIDGQTLHEFQFVLDVETPATDAYLAEVRAAEAKSIYEGILDNPAVTDMESLVDWLEQHAKDSISFAAQLRQGEKS